VVFEVTPPTKIRNFPSGRWSACAPKSPAPGALFNTAPELIKPAPYEVTGENDICPADAVRPAEVTEPGLPIVTGVRVTGGVIGARAEEYASEEPSVYPLPIVFELRNAFCCSIVDALNA
jgi:hypothetical protein